MMSPTRLSSSNHDVVVILTSDFFASQSAQNRQEGQLPQTDRASAFMVDAAKMFVASSLITMQNLVVVSHIVSARVERPKILGTLGPRRLGMGAWLKTRSCPTFVTNFGHSRSNRSSVIMEICQNISTPHARSRSRPYKVTRGHWNRHGSISHL